MFDAVHSCTPLLFQSGGEVRRGQLREFWVKVCRRGYQTPTLFKTKIAHFATMFKRNYILTLICFVLHKELSNFSH